MSIQAFQFDRIDKTIASEKLNPTGFLQLAEASSLDLCYIYCRWNGSAMEVWEHRVVADQWNKLGELPWNLYLTNGIGEGLTNQTFTANAFGFYFLTENMTPYDGPDGSTPGMEYTYYFVSSNGVFESEEAIGFVGGTYGSSGAGGVAIRSAPLFWQTHSFNSVQLGILPTWNGSAANLVVTPRIGPAGRGIDVRVMEPCPLIGGYKDMAGRMTIYRRQGFPAFTSFYRERLLGAAWREDVAYTDDPWAVGFEEGSLSAELLGATPDWATEDLNYLVGVFDQGQRSLQDAFNDDLQFFPWMFPTYAQALAGTNVGDQTYLSISGDPPTGDTGLEDLPSVSNRGLAVGAGGVLGRVVFDCGGDNRFAATNITDSDDTGPYWAINGVAAVHSNRRLMKLHVADPGTIPAAILDTIASRNEGGDWYQFGRPDWEMDGSWWPCACAIW